MPCARPTPLQDVMTDKYVTDKWKIAKAYLSTWFIIDFVSIVPFDLLGLLMESTSLTQLKVRRAGARGWAHGCVLRWRALTSEGCTRVVERSV